MRRKPRQCNIDIEDVRRWIDEKIIELPQQQINCREKFSEVAILEKLKEFIGSSGQRSNKYNPVTVGKCIELAIDFSLHDMSHQGWTMNTLFERMRKLAAEQEVSATNHPQTQESDESLAVQNLVWLTVGAATMLRALRSENDLLRNRLRDKDFAEAFGALEKTHKNASAYLIAAQDKLKKKYGIDLSKDPFQ